MTSSTTSTTRSPRHARPGGGADEPADDDAPADGGVASSEGIVRVWFDDDRRLAKVRLSPVWFTKLDTPEELERAFAQAFRLAAARVATVGPRPSAEVTDEEMGEVPELTNDSLAAAIAELEGMFGEWDEALERHLATPRPAPVAVSGSSGGATVTLNPAGHPWSVRFDPEWLDDAQVGAICNAVLAAANDATARRASTAEPDDEFEGLRHRHAVAMARLHRMCNPEGER